MSEPALILFDIDGTVFDSQAIILAGFARAFADVDLPYPGDDTIRQTIGLALEVAVAEMAPELTKADIERVCGAYKHAVAGKFQNVPFYPGMRRLIGALAQYEFLFLGAATGKNRRGLDPLLEANGLGGWFSIRQTPDHHPSKPHPAMIEDAVAQYGFVHDRVVMIGDTSYDIDMAKNAGVRSIGVSWGYHGARLRDAAPDLYANHPWQIFEQIRDWQLI